MSTSTRSKSESPSSPASGTEAETKAEAAEVREASSDEPLEIELELSRERLWGWAIGGVAIGILLVWKLGTVAVWGGYLLILLGIYRAILLVQTYRFPPGTIVVSPKLIKLPRGLHRPRPREAAPKDISAAYFLRRSVPWNKAAPVLVVELGEEAIAYPRDWFASEADQRQVIRALMSHCPMLSEAAEAAVAHAKPAT